MPRAWQSQVRDMAFEQILDDRIFSFRHLLVIPNPYGASVQTAMLLFNTPKEYRVRYRILGKTEGTDFVGETRMTTRHRVPIMGLYKGYTNKLILELIDSAGEVVPAKRFKDLHKRYSARTAEYRDKGRAFRVFLLSIHSCKRIPV